MKRIAVVTAALFVVIGCSSSDPDYGPPSRRGDDGRAMSRTGARLGAISELGLPPADWWRDAEMARAVNLSGEQVAQLEKISTEHAGEVERLRRDAISATRDVRTLLDADAPAAADITAAGQRLRTVRDGLLAREVQMLAAERTLLTHAQWTSLVNALREDFRQNRDDRRGYPGGRGGRGGRGGWGGGVGGGPNGGRWPGW